MAISVPNFILQEVNPYEVSNDGAVGGCSWFMDVPKAVWFQEFPRAGWH